MSCKIAVVGLSHLGLVTGLGFTSLKKQVIGLDTDTKLVNSLQKGVLPVTEPGLKELLKKFETNISFTTDFQKLSTTPFIFFSQDTALDGKNSVKKLDQLIEKALPYMTNKVNIVCMSQVPIGYYRQLVKKIKNARPDLHFHLYHMIDTIIMTNALERFVHPERIIIGSQKSKDDISPKLQSLLNLFHCPIFYMSYESAELTKAAINLYLANTVTFANTLSDYCESVGADINEVIPALKTDKRIGPFAYLRPTLRIAGGHLERDLIMLHRLAKNKNISSGVVKWIISQNKNRYTWAKQKLNQYVFKTTKKPTIAIWGLSYKKNTDSTRNAASLKIIKDLSKKACLQVYDPMAKMPKHLNNYKRFEDKYQALEKADCLLILTEWDEFTQINLKKAVDLMRQKIIIDSVGILQGNKSLPKNFIYIAMGKG